MKETGAAKDFLKYNFSDFAWSCISIDLEKTISGQISVIWSCIFKTIGPI